MKFQPRNPDFAARLASSFQRQGFMGFIGASLGEVRAGFCEMILPYRDELSQQHGFFHGGLIGTLADNVCAGAAFTLMAADSSILTVEYKLNLLAPGDGERLVARGEVIRPGRVLSVAKGEVFAVKEGRSVLCATALATLMALSAAPGGGAPG